MFINIIKIMISLKRIILVTIFILLRVEKFHFQKKFNKFKNTRFKKIKYKYVYWVSIQSLERRFNIVNVIPIIILLLLFLSRLNYYKLV
jgi:hypothetical protein